MPFIAMPLKDAKEDELVPEGEYELQIDDVDAQQEDKNGLPMTMCVIKILNPPPGVQPSPIFHYMTTVGPDDDANKARFKTLMTRRFLQVFGVPFTDEGFDTDDLMGAKGQCLVQHNEIKRDGRPSGEYSHQLRLPKLPNEASEEASQGGPRRSRRS